MAGSVAESEITRIKLAYESRKTTALTDRYSVLNLGNLCMAQERQRQIVRLLSRLPGFSFESARILDIGCGTGQLLREFISWGACPQHLFGVDLLPERIAEGRKVSPAGVTFVCGSAHHMQFDDSAFDLVAQSVVFSSILNPEMKAQIASEMLRVLKPGGHMLWYDFYVNSPGNPDVRGIGKKEIRRLFPGCTIRWQRITVVPPLGRVIGHYSASLYFGIAALKVLCTHYLALIFNPAHNELTW